MPAKKQTSRKHWRNAPTETSKTSKKSRKEIKEPEKKTQKRKGTDFVSSKKKKTRMIETKAITLMDEIEKVAARRGVNIVEVTADNAKDIHEKLCVKGAIKRLTKGKVRKTFVFDYLSSMHGSYLEGASLLGEEIPGDEEYDPTNKRATFSWDGLNIYVLERMSSGRVCGFLVFHAAYLCSYPGPDRNHHLVDPVMMAEGENIAEDIGNDGSEEWADVPILCGSGFGDVLIALAMQLSDHSNYIVNVATGKSNTDMIKLLNRWSFKKLRMTHPQTKKTWVDEDRVPMYMMYRKARISVKRCAHIFETRPSAKKAVASSKMSEMKEKNKEKMSKLKDSQHSQLQKRNDTISKIRDQLKDKDSTISQLKKEIRATESQAKGFKNRLMKSIRAGLDGIFGD